MKKKAQDSFNLYTIGEKLHWFKMSQCEKKKKKISSTCIFQKFIYPEITFAKYPRNRKICFCF